MILKTAVDECSRGTSAEQGPVAAACRPGVVGETERVEDGKQGEKRYAEDGDVEVADFRKHRNVSVGMCDDPEGDSSDGHTHTERELHDGGEKSVGARHLFRRDFSVGKCGHTGEFEGAARTVKEEHGEDESGWCGRPEGGAESDGDLSNNPGTRHGIACGAPVADTLPRGNRICK